MRNTLIYTFQSSFSNDKFTNKSTVFLFVSLFVWSFVFTEKVTEIKTNIFVTSFGPVSDTEMVTALFVFTCNLKLRLPGQLVLIQ